MYNLIKTFLFFPLIASTSPPLKTLPFPSLLWTLCFHTFSYFQLLCFCFSCSFPQGLKSDHFNLPFPLHSHSHPIQDPPQFPELQGWLRSSFSPPISFYQIPPTHRLTNDFPLTSFSSGPLPAQQCLVLLCHLLYASQGLSGLQGFPLILHPLGSHPTFISHYLSLHSLCSHKQNMHAISYMWFAHFHLDIFSHANHPPTDLQIHPCSLHQYAVILQNSTHPSSLWKVLLP